jgi:Mn2+/Fe2+ NRAMP family transporter
MFFIFRIGADESIMGRFTSPRWVNIWGWTATVLMAVSAVALIVVAALGK